MFDSLGPQAMDNYGMSVESKVNQSEEVWINQSIQFFQDK